MGVFCCVNANHTDNSFLRRGNRLQAWPLRVVPLALSHLSPSYLDICLYSNYLVNLRGRRNTYHHTSLIKLDGVQDTESSKYYFGKKIAFIYKAQAQKAGTKFRVVWGKVTTSHGANGVVRAKFAKNLDPKTIGSTVRVMMYPSSV